MKLFSERGLAATTIRDIAEESGYTNPALYKHFASKEELELYLFESSHRRIWSSCADAMASAKGSKEKLEAYVSQWLEFIDAYPEVFAFLSDSARVLWPKASSRVRRNSLISLAQSLFAGAPQARRQVRPLHPDLAAASLQGTIAELARMIQVGVVEGPALRWKAELVGLFERLID